MALTRPLKEGSVTTYQQKVALGFPDILASEMDADLDTIYAAWNGNVGTANLIDGAVTTPKLANYAVTTLKLADGNVTLGKLAPGAALAIQGYTPIVASATAAGAAPLLTCTLSNWRGGWLCVSFDAVGVVSGPDTAITQVVFNSALDGVAGPSRVLSYVASSNMSAGAATLPWTVAMGYVVNVPSPAASYVVQINWARLAGTGTWRADSGQLSAVGFA
jgi:hypothetical protein